MHTECQWDKDNSLPWFGDFFLSLGERKMTGNPGLQKNCLFRCTEEFFAVTWTAPI